MEHLTFAMKSNLFNCCLQHEIRFFLIVCGFSDDVKNLKEDNRKSNSKKKKKRAQEIVTDSKEQAITKTDEKLEKIREGSREESTEEKIPDVEMILEENKVKKEEIALNEIPKEVEDTKMETIVEKSVGTDQKSDFLAMVQNKETPTIMGETQTAKPREILELYETARYYGVVLDESSTFHQPFSFLQNF